MVADFVIRKATAADREAVLRVAAAGMREFGLTPDFTGLVAELGRIGEDRVSTVAEFVAMVGNTICASVLVSAKSGRVGKLSGFYVSDTYRGHGIGRAAAGGDGSIEGHRVGPAVPRDMERNACSGAVVRGDRLGAWRRSPDQQRGGSLLLAGDRCAQQSASAAGGSRSSPPGR